jgi:hypothetical protein
METVGLNHTSLVYVRSARLERRTQVSIAGRSSVCDLCPQSQEDEEVGPA